MARRQGVLDSLSTRRGGDYAPFGPGELVSSGPMGGLRAKLSQPEKVAGPGRRGNTLSAPRAGSVLLDRMTNKHHPAEED